MCGIAGVVNLQQAEPVSTGLLRAMADAQRHRGPDDDGIWRSPDGTCGLAHRRLSIVDLSAAGHQPMGNADGSVMVVFNGEIYNFRELRRDLEARGYSFRSDCDTEVLVYLYEEKGDAMVEELDGDFAFAIWDERRRRLFAARDRAGVNPFYYTVAGNRLLFASEIKALLADPAVARDIDERSLYDYLTYLVVPAPRSLFAGVYKLPAAGTLALELDRAAPQPRTSCYWKPFPRPLDHDGDLDERLEELLRRSVDKRLMSDVPVGVLFSGGVDSTLNAHLFSGLIAPEKVRTYTVGMSNAQRFEDESGSARRRAARLGSEHHEVIIDDGDLVATAERLVALQDEPVSDPVCVPLYFVCKLARETGTTVLHAGEGADEIFCGYDSYRRHLSRYERLWRPLSKAPRAAVGLGGRALALSSAPRHRKIADVMRRMARGQRLFMSAAVAYYEDEKQPVLAEGFRRRFADYDSFEVVAPLYRELEEAAPDASFLQAMTCIELQLRLPELLLMRVDKMSMASSIEVRVPFLDRDLVDFALSVPQSFKLRDGVSKEPLKRLARRVTGDDDVYRPKRGFGVPIQDWFSGELGDSMRDMLNADRDEIGRFFDVAEVRRRLDKGHGTVNEAFQSWVIYNLMNWRRSYLGAPCAAEAGAAPVTTTDAGGPQRLVAVD